MLIGNGSYPIRMNGEFFRKAWDENQILIRGRGSLRPMGSFDAHIFQAAPASMRGRRVGLVQPGLTSAILAPGGRCGSRSE